MFGLMNLETGKVWESEGSTFHKDLQDYNYRVDNHRIVAVPKDYINTWESGHKCEHEGCFKDGYVECRVPDSGYPVLPETLNTIEHFCPEHAYENGYCSLCGDFWGGIESFDFDNPSHLCEHCLEQVKDEIGEGDDINGED